MICNAGRNYLVFKPDGRVFRCQCHLKMPLGDMSDIDQWIPQAGHPCLIMEQCQRDFPSEWNRASRLDDHGALIDQGAMAGQPDNEVVTRMFLVGENMRSPEEWCTLFDRLARRYKKCWHRIEGGDPADFPGIAQLIEKVSFLGDHLFYVTNLSSRTTRLVDVLAKASVDCVRFTVIVDPTHPDFSEIKVLGRLRLIHERGFEASAVMPGTLGTFHLFEQFFEKISDKYGIPMGFVPEADFPEHMQARLASLVEMGTLKTAAKAEDQETFFGL